MRDNKLKEKYNALIIGAGSIGALKPSNFDSPTSKDILTHAHNFFAHDKMNLLGIVDIDYSKGCNAANKWSTDYYPYESLFTCKEKIDIISVCVPTEKHKEVLEDIIKLEPRIVIAEKPFTNSLEEAEYISDLYRGKNIPIVVNYTRRFNANYKFQESAYSCILHYDRGLKRDGSHFIDLCNYWFGEFIKGEIINTPSIIDYSENDPTYCVHLNYEKCHNVFMVPSDGREYSIFEIDIMANKHRYRFVDNGNELRVHGLIFSDYGDYKSMDHNFDYHKLNLKKALPAMLDEVVSHIEFKTPLSCTDKDALRVHEVYKKLGV